MYVRIPFGGEAAMAFLVPDEYDDDQIHGFAREAACLFTDGSGPCVLINDDGSEMPIRAH